MQPGSVDFSSTLTSTCFDLDAYEFNPNSPEFPTTLAVPREPLNEASEALPVITTVCLSTASPSARLENWQLAGARSQLGQITPNHIIGSVVRIAHGRTSPIVSIDPVTHRIRTESGSVYELGIPDPAFHKSAPLVLRYLGF